MRDVLIYFGVGVGLAVLIVPWGLGASIILWHLVTAWRYASPVQADAGKGGG